jgi:hypothetical protein
MKKKRTDICATCCYWDAPAARSVSGVCRRRAPAPAYRVGEYKDLGARLRLPPIQVVTAHALWVKTREDDWCGEHWHAR